MLESCLGEEFPGYSIEGRQAEQGGYLFRISKSEQHHTLYVDETAVAGKDTEDLRTFFYNCDVASVLRHVGDFTVSLTDSGCIFGNL